MGSHTLSEREFRDFARNGYIARRGVLDEETCRRCRDVAWRELERKNIGRDPTTWRSNPYLVPRKGAVKLRDEVNSDPALLEAFQENLELRSVADALMGSPLGKPSVRGLYPTFPIPVLKVRPYDGHVEEHLVQVFVMVYLDDVTESNGAMCAWPGTHTTLVNHFDSKLDFRPRPTFHQIYDRLNRFDPVQLTGKAGDAYFCHHRILHAGSNNTRDNVRLGALVDFLRDDTEALCESQPGADMWDYWSDELRAAASSQDDLSPDPLHKSASRLAMLKMARVVRRISGRQPDGYAP